MSKEHSLHKTTAALEKAIEANSKLQTEIKGKLKAISTAKQNNRLKCLKISEALNLHLEREANRELGNKEETETSDNEVLKGHENKLWNSKSNNRKWKRRFFVDPKRSIPEPNADEIQRRKWEGDLASGTFVHRFTPWAKIELDLLAKHAEEVRKEQEEEAQDGTGGGRIRVKDVDIDFRKVAERVQEELAAKKFTQNQITKVLSHTYSLSEGTVRNTYIPRPWIDHRIKFLNSVSPSINKRAFTKAESLKIFEFLHTHHGNPPWHIVAKNLNTSRTPFQCFRHAHTKLSNSLKEVGTPTIFSMDEDELLFKYIAASGPQFVINHHSATLMAQRFFPQVSHYQIIQKANLSLLNPKLLNEQWNVDEERMLTMGMKVYSESQNPPTMASGLLEGRSAKLTTDKWVRSINPIYNTQPFTETEDKALVAAVKRTKANWKAVELKFPTRNPRALQIRWMELAEEEDVAKFQVNQLMARGVRRLGRKGLRSSLTKRNRGAAEDEDVLTAKDFAVRFKKHKRT